MYDLSNCVRMTQFLDRRAAARELATPQLEQPEKNEFLPAIVGIEVEVEACPSNRGDLIFWNMTTDGSLRNAGREFISIPIRMWEVEPAFEELFEMFRQDQRDYGIIPDFSWRTSTHVHLNVRDLYLHQVGMLGLLEILFSKVLFSFVEWDREKSNFCVPNIFRAAARSTVLAALKDHPFIQEKLDMRDVYRDPHEIISQFCNHLATFSKYSSLNLLPTSKLGTVEYRHFHGADNMENLLTWIRLIAKMHAFVTSEKFDLPDTIQRIRKLNTVSDYEQFTVDVFGRDDTDILKYACRGRMEEFLKTGCFKSKQLLTEKTDPSRTIIRTSAFKGAKEFWNIRNQAAASEVAQVKKSGLFGMRVDKMWVNDPVRLDTAATADQADALGFGAYFQEYINMRHNLPQQGNPPLYHLDDLVPAPVITNNPREA